jgi:hypothetical protein
MIRRDLVAAAVWTLLLTTFVVSPQLYAHLVGIPGSVFSGNLIYFSGDTNSYLSWVRQGAEGSVYFVDRYTTETTARCFVHPVFLLLGTIQRLGGWAPQSVWVWSQYALALGATFSCYLFVRKALGAGRQAMLAFLVITLNSGLAWYTHNVDLSFESADYWMPELTFYQSLRWPVLWSIALMLMVGYFAAVSDAIGHLSRRATILAGFAFLGIAFVHPYHVVTFTAVAGVFLFVELLRNIRDDAMWRRIANYVLIGSIAAPAVLMQYAIAHTDPVLKAHSAVETISPAPNVYIAGLGPLIVVLAAVGLFWAWRRTPLERLVAVWAVVGSLLLYAPLPFNRRLATGLVIAPGVLASYPLDALVRRILADHPSPARVAAATGVVLLFLAAVAPTSLMVTKFDWDRVNSEEYPAFVSPGEWEALRWLDAAPRGVVLANPALSSLVPPYSGQIVYAGHWAQTMNFGTKAEQLGRLYRGELGSDELKRLLLESRARFVVYGPGERELTGEGTFDPATIGPVVYDNGSVAIVEVRRDAFGMPGP